MVGLKLNHVSERGLWWPGLILCQPKWSLCLFNVCARPCPETKLGSWGSRRTHRPRVSQKNAARGNLWIRQMSSWKSVIRSKLSRLLLTINVVRYWFVSIIFRSYIPTGYNRCKTWRLCYFVNISHSCGPNSRRHGNRMQDQWIQDHAQLMFISKNGGTVVFGNG